MATRTKTYEARLREAEAKVIEKVQQARAKHAEATADVSLATEQLEQASERFGDIESAFRTQAEPAPSIEDYMRTEAEVSIADLRVAGASARVNALAREAATNTDSSLAQIAADVAQRAVPGVPVYVTFLGENDYPFPTRSEDGLPCVVVSVKSVDRIESDGYLHGKAVISYWRWGTLLAPLSGAALERAALESEQIVRTPRAANNSGIRMRQLSDAITRDFVEVTVSGYAGPPRLSELAAEPGVARDIANSLARGLCEGGESPLQPDLRSPGYQTRRYRVAAHSESVVNAKVTKGVRTATVEATVVAQCDVSAGARDLDAQIKSTVENMVGRVIPGVGKVESVERLDGALGHGRCAAHIASKLPSRGEAPRGFEDVREVRLRLTAVSAAV